ncbi:hypothetical protein TCSYLVIO_004299 [Trypanosoma cruzi]|uniref:Uncharacterized protein n=2 Tax=Trypanosoma cruzi TaxID=5693 RepID=V5BRA3_TRYCR|nr:hypothetical protein TCSYLVIO_004299 [Trypanosoma cruzi]ESS67068.1 hypothetical protein TCDM_04301 [Trypanosoma cruzi Dm28c]PBJ72844.1 hypothetical protein BCY84_15100 [Trypanosoma cruzi cruzi]KAF8276078.1 hypothetical protein TcBrA4_0128780 [Trypanosoma cruzi]PWU99088.1 hypothetical protein C4B63_10g146 [Trypanosoma cruzi]
MWARTILRLCSSKQPGTTAPAAVGSSWMTAAAWASLGSEFAGVSEDKFLRPRPDKFLTPRATTDVAVSEELLQSMVEENEERYKGIDVRDPSSMAVYEGDRPRWMTLGSQVRAVSEFISGHLCHHISLPEWKALFDLQYAEMDLTYWLYVLHVHMVSRRATSIPIEKFNRRREVLEEILLTMFESWAATSEDIMGRPPLNKIRFYIKDMYYVTAVNFEEALLHDGAGADLMLLGFLMKFCPLPRPEDVPLYTYYSLVHYVRFHTALLDRIPDDLIAKGNFNFLSPTDPRIFERYDDVALDRVIRSWTVDGANVGESSDEAGVK